MTGGVLEATNSYVGYSGTGNFDQNGGTHKAGSLTLGENGSSTGSYNLLDGTLNTRYSYVGDAGTGIFNQNGGTHSVSNELQVGSQDDSEGEYNLSGGVLDSSLKTTNTLVGNAGTGIFNQDGGTHSVRTILRWVPKPAALGNTFCLKVCSTLLILWWGMPAPAAFTNMAALTPGEQY